MWRNGNGSGISVSSPPSSTITALDGLVDVVSFTGGEDGVASGDGGAGLSISELREVSGGLLVVASLHSDKSSLLESVSLLNVIEVCIKET